MWITWRNGSSCQGRPIHPTTEKLGERDKDSLTPLMCASGRNPDSGLVTVLLKAGADPNARNKNGSTPLMYAAGNSQNPEVIITVRISELLPAPFGPKSPNMRLPIDSERFFSAFTPFGYVLDRPVIVSAKGTVLRFLVFYRTLFGRLRNTAPPPPARVSGSFDDTNLARPEGFEPPTYWFEASRSIHLSVQHWHPQG